MPTGSAIRERVDALLPGRLDDLKHLTAMHFDDSGRVVEYWTLSSDQTAVDAFIG